MWGEIHFHVVDNKPSDLVGLRQSTGKRWLFCRKYDILLHFCAGIIKSKARKKSAACDKNHTDWKPRLNLA